MKLNEFIKKSHPPAKLIRATIKQFGGWEDFKQAAPDVVSGGIDGGFSGFIYYSETVDFTKKNKTDILAMAENQALEFDIDVVKMISGFGCLKNSDIKSSEISKIIYSGKGEKDAKDIVYNCLAWYAGEEVCRSYCDLIENS